MGCTPRGPWLPCWGRDETGEIAAQWPIHPQISRGLRPAAGMETELPLSPLDPAVSEIQTTLLGAGTHIQPHPNPFHKLWGSRALPQWEPRDCTALSQSWAGPGDSVVVAVPKETCFLDRVGAQTPMVQHMEHLPTCREPRSAQPHSKGPACPTASRPLPREEQPFLGLGVEPVSCGPEEPVPRPPGKCCGCGTSSHLKAVSSVFISLLLVPWVLYGLYYLLPFEPPLCPDLASRVAFALRCLLIAVVPSILGAMFGALAKLCPVAIDPLDTRSPPVLLHRLYITSSTEQLVLFGLNTVVLATFLAQEHLRLIPILAGLFSIGRCCYWISLHVGSAYRGFGFGISFFPALAMTVYNLFCLVSLRLRTATRSQYRASCTAVGHDLTEVP
uniref:Transmembrane protein 79 n=1 Tax=Chelonoidis abingdonii TaxID=106734 RepID=A0A8C0GCB6_CHEAB